MPVKAAIPVDPFRQIGDYGEIAVVEADRARVLARRLPFVGGAGGVADRQRAIEAGLRGLVTLDALINVALQDGQQLDGQLGDVLQAEARQVVDGGGVRGERHVRVSMIGEEGLEGGHHAAARPLEPVAWSGCPCSASSSADSDTAAAFGLGRATAM